jgi:hypothetical protein
MLSPDGVLPVAIPAGAALGAAPGSLEEAPGAAGAPGIPAG